MSLLAKHFRYTTTGSGAGGTDSLTGFGFQPKLLLVWYAGSDGSGVTTRDGQSGFGVAVSGAARCIATTFDNGNPNSGQKSKSVCREDSVVQLITPDAAQTGRLTVAFDADGITWTYAQAFGQTIQLECLALGGTEITAAELLTFAKSNVTPSDTQDVTGFSFTPSSLLLFGTGNPATNTVGEEASFTIGATTGTGSQFVFATLAGLFANPVQALRYCQGGHCYGKLNQGGLQTRAELAAFIAGGFTLDWTVNAPHSDLVFALAIQGPSIALGSLLTGTDTSTPSAVSGLAFQPKAGMLVSAGQPETADAATDHSIASLGMFDGSSQSVGSFRIQDASDPSSCVQDSAAGSVYQNLSTSAAPVVGQGAISAINSDGFELLMSDADPSASFAWFVVFGDTGGGGSSPVSASFTDHYEARAVVSQSQVAQFESRGNVSDQQISAFEHLARVAMAESSAYEALEGVASAESSSFEARGRIDDLIVSPFEHLSRVSVDQISPYESLFSWPWGGKTPLRVALFVHADDQVAGQTVFSRVGPNGWLGKSPGDTVGDPTLDAGPPARIVFGQQPNLGLGFGDVLGDVFGSGLGFTAVVAFESDGDAGGFYTLEMLNRKHPTLLDAAVEMFITTGEFSGNRFALAQMTVKLNGTTGFTNYIDASAQIPDHTNEVLRAGRWVIGFDYDKPSAPPNRINMYWNGARIADSETLHGADNPIISAGYLTRFAGDWNAQPPPQTFGTTLAPESLRAFLLVEGTLDAATHAAAAQWFRDNGWTMPVQSSEASPYEALQRIAALEAQPYEALATIEADFVEAWEALGAAARKAWLEFELRMNPALEASLHADAALKGTQHVSPALDGEFHVDGGA